MKNRYRRRKLAPVRVDGQRWGREAARKQQKNEIRKTDKREEIQTDRGTQTERQTKIERKKDG